MRARPLATALAAGFLALAVLPGLAACSSNAANSASAPEINLSGTPVAAQDDMTALCKQIVDQKLPLEAAEALADANGYTSRVTKTDGSPAAVTSDLREDRFNFEVEADVVVACTVG